MTVKELIDKLTEMPPEAKVFTGDGPVEDVFFDKDDEEEVYVFIGPT